ncbi:KTSC domain-containing protein [Mesorhizobium sp. BH1-1-5]|uniref:KTSC domain-containing protein n=1 Tax=Mesorhizobium sp. BH1-1-5 TaxID=2876661 RepID=UPI001CCD82F8|nr:KTSC domain-containing protein [Mesorhizobium sp. BH1-1-5]MBZ9991611.1 KTSC domain-containing protein [Mesorhizobium sp. BH1-1-5]
MPSTAIRNIRYDPSRRILSVWFVPSGDRYDYEGVGPETYAAFKAASSKGQFFNECVRDRFRYRLVEHGGRH